jgi:glycosyltransferase involved in cell wall biosynthesis
MKKSVSIIIPTFQRSNQLIKILDTLKNQIDDWNFFEILICDSFSSDNSQLYVNNFFKKNYLNKIKYLNIKTNILAAKRNFGIM